MSNRFDTTTRTFDVPNAKHLAYLAAVIAVEAPARESKYANCAYIPWELVNEIRAALTEIGFDWRKAATKRARLEREQRRREAYP